MTVPTAVSSVSLVKMKVEDEKITIPPDEFHRSITSRRVAGSSDCCFVLYCMNKVHLKEQVENDTSNPFDLFKDCYKRNKNMGYGQQLQRYFCIRSIKSPLAEDLGDSWDGTTVLKNENENQVTTLSEMSIYPQILRYHKFNSSFDTEKHLKAYETRFRLVLEKFNPNNLSHLYVNWLKLIESYVELVFRDLTIKWCQWLHSIRAAGQRRSMKSSLETILPRICGRFWRQYFAFHHSLRKSIGSTTALLSKRATALGSKPCQQVGAKFTFAVWFDSINGILILGNGVVFPNMSAGPQDTHVAPVCGVCLDEVTSQMTTKRLMLFLNLAIVECFLDEI